MATSSAAPRGLNDGPLSGIRVLDFSRQFAGALGTRILGGYGAEILRVEWPEPPGLDFVRMISPADGVPGFNRGGMFNGANMDKRSFTLNMATDEGRELAKRLVAVSDVVYENMTPRVMKNWGMDYDSLREIKSDVIYVSCSGFGQSGPTSQYRSYGSPSQAHAGIVHLAGIPGKPPAGWGFQIGDTHAGAANSIQVLMALHHHRETGRGVFIDAAQTQGNATVLGQYLLDQSVNGRDLAGPDFPPANRRLHPRVAPHNAFPCLGDDKWCAIAVMTDDEWVRLVEAIGSPAWALDSRFVRSAGRWQYQEFIDEELTQWTLDLDRYHVARHLQAHGVRAGVVQDAGERLNWDRQLAHRGTYATFEHPEVGLRRHETVAAKLSRTPYEPGGPAPLLGQHNDYVFGEVLGLDEDQLRGLEERDVIRTLVDDSYTLPQTRQDSSSGDVRTGSTVSSLEPPAKSTGGALGGLLVIELGDEGTHAGAKALADMGATVIKVEPPGGVASRHRGPFVEGREGDPNASLYFWNYNTNKDSVELDISDLGDRTKLLALVARADVFLEDFRPGHLAAFGLDFETLAGVNPRLVYGSVTDFGQTGPLSDWLGGDMVTWAMGGGMAMVGYSDRSSVPLAPQGEFSYQLAGQWLCIGVMAALAGRATDGVGQHVDVALQEVVAITTDGYGTAPFEYEGRLVLRNDLMNMVQAGDGGYIVAQMLNITDDKWAAFKDWLIERDAIGDLIDLPPSEFESNRPRIVEVVDEIAKSYPADELCKIGQEFGFTWMKVNSAQDLFEDEQLRFRGFYRDVEHPELDRVIEYPGPGAEWSEAGWELRRRPPLLGEDNDRWLGATSL